MKSNEVDDDQHIEFDLPDEYDEVKSSGEADQTIVLIEPDRSVQSSHPPSQPSARPSLHSHSTTHENMSYKSHSIHEHTMNR